MVGLEKTFYQVREDVGVVEVCAIVYSPTIDCPIEFLFNVSLSTRNNSAGIHSDECMHSAGIHSDECMHYIVKLRYYINIHTKKNLCGMYSHLYKALKLLL